jgi:hypothetical protein
MGVAGASVSRPGLLSLLGCRQARQLVIAGLDPAIYPFEKFLAKNDGCPVNPRNRCGDCSHGHDDSTSDNPALGRFENGKEAVR